MDAMSFWVGCMSGTIVTIAMIGFISSAQPETVVIEFDTACYQSVFKECVDG